MNFFRKYECTRSCQLPISSNLLKKCFRKTKLTMLTKATVTEKVFCYLHINILIQDLNHKFQNTFFEEQPHQLCLILVVFYQIVHNTSQQILTVQLFQSSKLIGFPTGAENIGGCAHHCGGSSKFDRMGGFSQYMGGARGAMLKKSC